MSSRVVKSHTKFTPKIRQRRSSTATPNASRRASIVPPPDVARKQIDNSSSITNDEYENSSDESDAFSTTSTNTTRTLERSQENRSRRLSTLNNISNRELFKKVSVQGGYTHDSSNVNERKGQIIGIPQPPVPTKRRRSTISRRGSTLKRKSASEAPGSTPITVTPTPTTTISIQPPQPPTISEHEPEKLDQDDPKSTQQSEISSQTQNTFTSSLPISSTPASSLPSSAPIDPKDDGASKETTETTETTERPSTAPEKEASPLPVGIPIMRPETAPVSSNAPGKGLDDFTKNSKVRTQDAELPDVEFRESIAMDPVTGNLITTRTRIDKGVIPEDVNYKIRNYNQLPKLSNNADADLTKNIAIDEEHFTIADLCKPSLRIGKVSKDYAQAREARKNKSLQRRQKKLLRMQARDLKVSIEYLEEELANKVKTEEAKKEEDAADIPDEDQKTEEGEAKQEEDEDKKEEEKAQEEEKELIFANNTQGIQVKVGADGKLVVDEESRILDRHANMGEDTRERYNENPFENVVNSATYGKQRYTDKWSTDEIERFYRSLGTWGTDFGLIAQMFPHRTRRQVKAKFILEEKKRPRLIELALNNKLNGDFNFDEYCSDSNKAFGTLDDFNVKLEQLKKDHEENLKELSVAREKAKEEDAIRQRKREEEVKANGGAYNVRPLTRQERLVELRKHETVLGSIDDVKKQREEEEAESAAA